MNRTLLAILVLVSACSSRRPEDTARKGDRTDEQRRVSRSAGRCETCNLSVYDGHICARTAPCKMCEREHGARHYHEMIWKCGADDRIVREVHVCNDSKTCDTCLHGTNANPRCELCRTKMHVDLLTKSCGFCSRMSPLIAVRGITAYCATCNQEVGANHIHGKTVFCERCLREGGQGHVCDVTRLCTTHERDCAVDHEHGKTEYCEACRRDAGPNHKHGDSIYCIRCRVEVPWPHCYHVGGE